MHAQNSSNYLKSVYGRDFLINSTFKPLRLNYEHCYETAPSTVTVQITKMFLDYDQQRYTDISL